MKRWDDVSIDKLHEMRARGCTSSEISKEVCRSKSAVEMRLYIEGLTKDGKRRSLKNKSTREVRERKIDETVSFLSKKLGYAMGYVLGVLCGDGFISNQKRGGVVLGLGVRSREFAAKFSKCLEEICPPQTLIRVFDYKYTPKDSVIKTPGRSVLRVGKKYTSWNVTCCDPGVAKFFEYLKASFLGDFSVDPSSKKGVIDGLLDSEGYFSRTTKTAGIGMTNRLILQWLSEEFLSLGIHNKVYTGKNGYYSYVSIHRKDAVKKFCETVKFSVSHRESFRLLILGLK